MHRKVADSVLANTASAIRPAPMTALRSIADVLIERMKRTAFVKG